MGNEEKSKPRFYIMDLGNYHSDHLRDIILWQDKRIKELELKGSFRKIPDQPVTWKRQDTYSKYPVWFWRLLCFLRIKHNWLLVEFHTFNHKTQKKLSIDEQYGVYECVYCLKRKEE